MGLQISTRVSAGITILDLRGKLTIDGGECVLLRNHLQELIDNGVRKFLLNLTDLTQIDSSGVTIVVKTYRSIRDQGGDLRLLHPSGHAREVFRVLHLLEMIPSSDEENVALASFGSVGCLAKP